MPEFTFSEDTVIIAGTGTPAIGATGVFRPQPGAPEVSVWDLNDSPLSVITVSSLGVHEPFRADISFGFLDFGSVQKSKVADEAIAAVLTLQTDVESALSQVANLQEFKAGVDHDHLAEDITDFAAAVEALGAGIGGGVGLVDGGTPSSTFSDVFLDGGTPEAGGGLRLVSDL